MFRKQSKKMINLYLENYIINNQFILKNYPKKIIKLYKEISKQIFNLH